MRKRWEKGKREVYDKEEDWVFMMYSLRGSFDGWWIGW